VDDHLFTGDIGVSTAQTGGDLTALLRVVHVRADRPSMRALEARARHYRTPLSKTVVSEMLRGTRFPRKAVMLSFLRACGVADEAMDPWRRTWERLAADEQKIAPHPIIAEPDSRPRAGFHAVQRTAEPSVDEPTRRVSRDHELPANVLALPEAGPVSPPDATRAQGQAKASPSPAARRRELSALLRQLRLNAGLTIEQVAERLLCSPSKVSRMETGVRAGTMRDIRDLCDLYGVADHAQRDYLTELVRESRKQGWWQSYGVLFGTYIGLESDASSISVFHATVVPGLLQTADYARAILTATRSGPEGIDQLVEVRLRRQELLNRDDPPEVLVVLDEAALRRQIGGPSIMKPQLDRIIEQSGLPNVSVRVIPYARGAYKAIDSSFIMLEFANQMAGIVFVEGLFGLLYIEREQDLERYREVFLSARSSAMSEDESIELITEISDGMA
jgi:transcriptional regulator with XRE-family HTH domain